jgi:hypothetical protein
LRRPPPPPPPRPRLCSSSPLGFLGRLRIEGRGRCGRKKPQRVLAPAEFVLHMVLSQSLAVHNKNQRPRSIASVNYAFCSYALIYCDGLVKNGVQCNCKLQLEIHQCNPSMHNQAVNQDSDIMSGAKGWAMAYPQIQKTYDLNITSL